MEISFISPPHPNASRDRCDVPLGLLYMASILEKEGHNVSVSDFAGGVPWDIGWADIYGITVYAPTIEISRQIALKCREINPRCCIVVGGGHPTMAPESIDFADSIVIGEGELAMVDLSADYPNVKKRYERVLDKNLDLYPNAAYHLLDVYSYDRVLENKPCISILSSRGCPYRCAFCALPPHRKAVKYRLPDSIAAELRMLKTFYGFEKFNFMDDAFTANHKHLERVLDLIRPLHIGFRCLARVSDDSAEEYKRLRSAGCELLSFGTESGSQKILDRMNKKSTVEQNLISIKRAKEAGIRTKAFFIIGFPGETKETVEETKRFIEKAKPDEYCVSNFVPYPGSEVWNNPDRFGIVWQNKDFDKYYQLDKTEHGGINISTNVLSASEFKVLEIDFRCWLKEMYNGEVVFNG